MKDKEKQQQINKKEAEVLIGILKQMLRIRIFEERVAKIAENNEIQNPVHLYVGQEAIAAGVCANLRDDDYVFSTHRSHGHYIAKGGNLNKLMAEIYCRETGCSRGRGGSMHVVDKSVNYMASSAIVAGTIPIAAGSALASKIKGADKVSVAFFGEGATDEGVFYETINLATLYKLPIIFVCENNRFSTHQPDFLRQSNIDIHERIKGFNINVKRVDGNNPLEVYSAVKEMVERARSGAGPSLIECMTFRWLAHVGPTPDFDIGYRKKKDVLHWMGRCPINYLKDHMISQNDFTEEDYFDLKKRIAKKVEDSVVFAKESPYPNPESLEQGLFTI